MFLILTINLVLTAPSFVAAYAILKRKRWAKTAGVVAAVVDGLSFPLGSALCVYTLMFMFGERGRHLYGKNAYALPPPPPRWGNVSPREREVEYIPPSSPPDWR
jgi:hypothetical protein